MPITCFRVVSVPSHPSRPFTLAALLTRLYDAHVHLTSSPFRRAKAVLNETHKDLGSQVINKLHGIHPSPAHSPEVAHLL
ncbi:hypothetical protein TNCV_4295671 [Trichonephila clavipes]|nr:hypothetical protein TNCV_4295671 [Trichonephila clavipes]